MNHVSAATIPLAAAIGTGQRGEMVVGDAGSAMRRPWRLRRTINQPETVGFSAIFVDSHRTQIRHCA
jgi:hypothetical protein